MPRWGAVAEEALSVRPPLSIVIPAFNEAARLPGTLRALGARFDGAAAEIVVVDDGS
ncbi:MAG: glycosyltransferase, partial [Actinomycetota bacterium]